MLRFSTLRFARPCRVTVRTVKIIPMSKFRCYTNGPQVKQPLKDDMKINNHVSDIDAPKSEPINNDQVDSPTPETTSYLTKIGAIIVKIAAAVILAYLVTTVLCLFCYMLVYCPHVLLFLFLLVGFLTLIFS